VQNVLYVLQTKGGVWKLHPRAEVFNAATGKFYKVVDGGYYTVKLPYTATLTTKVISTKAIAFTDSVVGTSPFYTWPNTSAYTFSTVAVGVSPATDPQAVLVGPGNSTGVTFLAGSAGTVSSSATLQAGTTAPGTVCPVSGTNLWTKETSTGLAWTVTGSKATFGTGAGTPAEGVVFMPQRLACP
jgi:hypothetical protein